MRNIRFLLRVSYVIINVLSGFLPYYPAHAMTEDEDYQESRVVLSKPFKRDQNFSFLENNEYSQVLEINDSCEVMDHHLRTIALYFPRLVELRIHGSHLTDEGIMTLTRCPFNLVKLGLRETRLADQGLKAVAKRWPDLIELDISWSSEVTNEGLKYLTSHCEGITTLSLSGCSSITDKGLGYLSVLENIGVLNLSLCINICDTGVESIIQSCCKISVLNLSKCSNITGHTIRVISENCPHLRELMLTGCTKIEKRDWVRLFSLPMLEKLILPNEECLGRNDFKEHVDFLPSDSRKKSKKYGGKRRMHTNKPRERCIAM